MVDQNLRPEDGDAESDKGRITPSETLYRVG